MLVSSSCRPISPIELASSSAAIAAVLTLNEASLGGCTAPSACWEVSPDELDSVVAVDFIACALSPTVFNSVVHLAAKRRDRRLDHGAPFFQRGHLVAFLLEPALLGDVLVGADPAAARASAG